ncbi:MAG: hypothetical protein DHS20C18_14270 [Saprospiraceae bacterium]|nr:MAG: hypothetical protein DHS20C18_14270 [Saprospiraceae bacterium]
MKKLLVLGLISLFLMAADCHKEDVDPNDNSITLTFKGKYDTEPLVMFADEYSYEEGMNVKFQLFQFYISKIELVQNNNAGVEKVTPLSDVELVSFKGIVDPAEAQQGISFTYKDLPDGTFSHIRFGLGLTPELNATNPSDYTPPHPLDDHYWSAALGYVFTKIEGNVDFDGDGEYTNEGKITFHAGKDNLYKEVSFPIDWDIEDGHVGPINFVVDLKKVLSNGPTDFLDFRDITQDHTNNPEVYETISNRLKTALRLE